MAPIGMSAPAIRKPYMSEIHNKSAPLGWSTALSDGVAR